MNSIPGSNIIRQKAIVETVFELPLKTILTSPRQDTSENFYVCSHSGEIIKFNDKGEYSVSLSISDQQPSNIIFINHDLGSNNIESDNKSNSNEKEEETIEELYISDIANSAIYEYKSFSEGKVRTIKDYQGNPLKGPKSLTVNYEDNSILFCDAGYFETTSLNNPLGSVYRLDIETKELNPILYNCLAFPSDIYFDNLLQVGYIAETFNNRILRMVENPQGEYHISVFYVFNGRVGPTSITCDDDGNIYVSRFDYQSKDGDVDGVISVITKDGLLAGELIVPKLPEITGMYIPRKDDEEENVKNDTVLYFTERSFSGVKRIKINQFIQDMDKALDSMKMF